MINCCVTMPRLHFQKATNMLSLRQIKASGEMITGSSGMQTSRIVIFYLQLETRKPGTDPPWRPPWMLKSRPLRPKLFYSTQTTRMYCCDSGRRTYRFKLWEGMLAISTSTALAAPSAGSPNYHTLQLLLRL
jgi:hypothetical protein